MRRDVRDALGDFHLGQRGVDMNTYTKDEVIVLVEGLLSDRIHKDNSYYQKHGVPLFSQGQTTGYKQALQDLLNLL